MTLPLNPKDPAHRGDNITERTLLFIQATRHLDLDAGEHGHTLAHHVRRDRDLGPPTKVRPSLGGGVQWARFLKDNNTRIAADNLARPCHPGVDAKQALVCGKGCQDFPYTFGFFHTNIIT